MTNNNQLILKKEFPAKVIRATINNKDLLLVVFSREGRYIGTDFRAIYLNDEEKQIVSQKLAEIRRDIKLNGPKPISLLEQVKSA